jgi:hypothetical protein
MTTPRPRRVRAGLWAKSVVAAFLVLAVGGVAESAPERYIVIKLANNHSYSTAYARVNKQLTVLQSKRAGRSRRAKCRNDEAITWLAEQGKETASWEVVPSEMQRNNALVAEIKSELTNQSQLQPCKRLEVRRQI